MVFRSSSVRSGSATPTTGWRLSPRSSVCKIYDQFEDGETTYEFAGEVLSGVRRSMTRYGCRTDRRSSGCSERAGSRWPSTVQVEAPWTALPRPTSWDRITVGAVVRRPGTVRRSPVRCSRSARWGSWPIPTVEVSLLDLLYNVAGVRGDRPSCWPSPRGEHRPGASSAAPRRSRSRLADAARPPDCAQLPGPHHRPHRRPASRSRAAVGLVATGRQVIVALSPTLAGRIMYDPPLPGVRDQLTQRAAASLGAQGLCSVRRAVLAQRRAERPADLGGGAGTHVQRQLPAGRHRWSRHHSRVPGG